jgi:oxalate decarboxylase
MRASASCTAARSWSNAGVYEEIDLSEWIASNPVDVLATNFGRPAPLFQKFPHNDVFIAPGNGKQ